MNAPTSDERGDPRVDRERSDDADRDGARDRDDGERDEQRARDPRPERPAVQLVERVRADTDREEEGGQRGEEPVPGEGRGERGADGDVAQVPRRVGRVEERDVVAPASRRERVEGRAARLSLHACPT